ncbi:MAG: hypothetical protein RL536_648 [Candidatus Parcubacteria bacterium]
MIIYYHPRFQKSFHQLDERIRDRARDKVELFRANPFDKRLDTHHLHGKLRHQLSFSVTAKIRILFEFYGSMHDQVVFLDIGDHDIYR